MLLSARAMHELGDPSWRGMCDRVAIALGADPRDVAAPVCAPPGEGISVGAALAAWMRAGGVDPAEAGLSWDWTQPDALERWREAGDEERPLPTGTSLLPSVRALLERRRAADEALAAGRRDDGT